jgi:hypothetical protein
MRRAVFTLYQLCGNQEARESFTKWQRQLAAALGLPELARPIGDMAGERKVLQMTLREDDVSFAGLSATDTNVGGSKSESRANTVSVRGSATGSASSGGKANNSGRKSSFMDKLLGRRRGSGMVAVGVV